MQKGLWKFIQHPNYLGELMFWWGISLSSVAFIPFYFGLISSFWISFILIGFSGIPVLQKHWNAKYNKEIDYQEYAKKTYKLIPYIY